MHLMIPLSKIYLYIQITAVFNWNEHSGSTIMICKLNMIGKLIKFDVSHY